MKRRAALAGAGAVILGAVLPARAAEAGLAMLADWRADAALAAGKRQPVLLFFSLPGCRFCEHLRRHYMLALVRSGELVREVEIGSDAAVAGWPGALTQREVARAMGVTVAPVVILVDAQGRALADPIVGGDVAGLYGGYLDNAFEEARRRLSR